MYAEQHALTLGDELGAGVHGIVFASESQSQRRQLASRSAVKAHQGETEYGRERDVYLRLTQKKIEKLKSCNVPQLLRYDDDFLIIEMTIVQRPYILDFAGAYLDKPLDFSEEVMADWYADKLEQFEKHWPEVQAILAILESYGIFMEDVNPKNITVAD